MTAKPLWIEDLMRYFGIITIEEDGTINHTMATLLIDQKGRIHYRKEGSVWKVDDFLARAQEILKNKMHISLNKRTQSILIITGVFILLYFLMRFYLILNVDFYTMKK